MLEKKLHAQPKIQEKVTLAQAPVYRKTSGKTNSRMSSKSVRQKLNEALSSRFTHHSFFPTNIPLICNTNQLYTPAPSVHYYY
jgi:hypothetical protein